MALKPLNSVGGFSVGETPSNVILSNGYIQGNGGIFTGNLLISNATASWGILTDNLYYSNGTPWDMQQPGGSNTQIQFNDSDSFGGSANFTFDKTTSFFTVLGNSQFNNANLGNLATANFVNVASNVITSNLTVNLELAGNTANFSGNIKTLNANLGNLATANFVNVASNTLTNNLTVNLAVSGNTANFSGNIVAANANLGNLVTANFFTGDGGLLTNLTTGTSIVNGNSNVYIPAANGNVNISAAGNANVVVVTGTGMNVSGTLNASGNANVGNLGTASGLFTANVTSNNATVNLEFQANTANFDGNVTMDSWLAVSNTANVGNLRTDNLLYANGTPWDLGGNPGGSNTQIQYNDGAGNFGGSANFTFDNATNNLYLNGNANIVSTLLVGNIANAGNISVTNNLNGNVANFSGNLTALNANLGNLATANYVNVANDLNGNVANFSGNLTAANASLGNLATANFVNVASNIITSNLTVNLEVSGNTANFTGNVRSNNFTVNAEFAGNTANFSGNVILANLTANGNVSANNFRATNDTTTNTLTVNNAITGNTANFSGNVTMNNATVNLQLNGNTANFTGNVIGANFIGDLANGNSNIKVYSNANIEFSVNGTANVVRISGNSLYVVGQIESTAGNMLANGNVTANGSLNGGNANVTGEVLAGSVKTANITATTGNIDISAAGVDSTINLNPTGNGTVDVSSKRITNLADPVNDQDAATKIYVDNIAQGLHVHAPCLAATPDTLANISSGTVTYNNGTAGVGANLTTTGTFSLVDTVNIATVGTRILVKNEANAAHNGIYTYTSSTVLTRATDFDTSTEMAGGDFTFVNQGATYNDTGWVMTDPVTTVGTSAVTFVQFSGAGTYTAGNGIALNGSVFSANVDGVTTAIVSGNIAVKASANLTTPNVGDATFQSLSWNNSGNGNVTANNLSISNIANISGNLTVLGTVQVSGNIDSNANIISNNSDVTNFLTVGGNTTSNNITSNNLITTTNANISSNLITNNATVNLAFVGNTANFSGNVILPNLTVNLELAGNTANFSGNVRSNNFTVNLALSGNTANFSGNVILPNLTVNTTLSGNVGNFTGNLTAANANLGNLVTANFFTGTLVNGTSNVAIPSTNGNINLTAAGNTTLVVTGTGANVSGTANITGNINGGANLNLSSNLFANNLQANNDVTIGNTAIHWGTVTTSAITGNQTIATIATSGITGYEFIVKGVDSTGSKYSVATVTAVTDGTSVDYVTYATAALGGATGVLAVNVVGGNIALQVTPSSSNSTVWTTQYRTI